MKKSEFAVAFDQICNERNLNKQIVLDAIEIAIVTAYKKDFGTAQNVTAKMDPETGQAKIHIAKEVVEEVQDQRFQTSLDEAKRINENAELGELVMFENTPKSFGRIAAQTAKQVILQRIREAERDVLFNSYAEREGELINGTVQNIMHQGVTLNLGRTEALLPKSQQIPGEYYRLNQRVRGLVLEVRKTNRGPQIIVSRTHRSMLRRLLELEVPEIFNGTVEIKAIAREAGSRSKVAVGAVQAGIDPVGACVGMRGVRIQSVVKELNGEKIDVVEWSPDTSVFISNALSPAKVMNTYLTDNPSEGRTATVIVPDDQLSLAIGKGGQNARLAAKLTNWRIDIKSATEAAAAALQKAKEGNIAQVSALADKKDILAMAEAILLKKEEAPPTAQEMRVLKEAIDVIETAAAQEIVEEKEKESITIETLGLSTRVYNALNQAGFATVEEILETLAEGDKEILVIKNFGPKSLVELKDRLQAQGFIAVEEAEEVKEIVEIEEIEAVVEEPVEAAEEEVVEAAVPEVVEEIDEVTEEAAEVAPAEEAALAEEMKPAEEPFEEEKEEEPILEYEEEEEDELEERRKREKRRELVYDEELGKMVAKRHRKPGRHRDDWEDLY
ncbi:MAG: transcription termination/antitermination protein NusA [Anaerolineales bacterium]|nr:transcription termination/antitermination protein NusA [Anaerolineales bacterium]